MFVLFDFSKVTLKNIDFLTCRKITNFIKANADISFDQSKLVISRAVCNKGSSSVSRTNQKHVTQTHDVDVCLKKAITRAQIAINGLV